MIGVPVVLGTDAKAATHSRCVMPDSGINQMTLDQEVDRRVRMVDTSLDIKCVTQ
jgi:hypothetical protein